MVKTMFDPNRLARENIRRVTPYSSARSEFVGSAEVYLDANENAFGSPIGVQLNRYPDPIQSALKKEIAVLTGVRSEQIFVGNGSDEAIDLLFRIFCEPRRDAAAICPPTYGMYKVAADINDVEIVEIPLLEDFQLNVPKIVRGFAERTKLLFICSPNNPTGNTMIRKDILEIAKSFAGIVVVDEAYIHFSNERSLIDEIGRFPNIVVLQTFSKAWGLAGARVGLAFASERIIALFNLVKPPYNVSDLSQKAVLEAIQYKSKIDRWVGKTKQERLRLHDSLTRLEMVERVYSSEANFLLVKVSEPAAVYHFLLEEKIVVRDRSNVLLCEGCLRITVGTPEENNRLITSLAKYEAGDNSTTASGKLSI